MDEKKIEEIVSEIVRGADPEKIPAYRRASYDDRKRIDARVVEIRLRRAALEAQEQDELRNRRERDREDPPQHKF